MERTKKFTLRELLNSILNDGCYVHIDGVTDRPMTLLVFNNEIRTLDCWKAYADCEIKSIMTGVKFESPLLYITLHYPSNFKEQLDQIEKRTQLSFEDMLK